MKGGFARVQHLQSRPELNGEVVQLNTFDAGADRWECSFGDGQGLRLRPATLAPL